jgi:hypothetical protein
MIKQTAEELTLLAAIAAKTNPPAARPLYTKTTAH